MSHKGNFNDSIRRLMTVGCSWFVVKLYHDKIDPSYRNWEKVKTLDKRLSAYTNHEEDYKAWLIYLGNADLKKMERNTIGITASELKVMIDRLLAVL